ncbi:MAG: hypothetical protein VST67_12940, partial [Nitrospirota bacterium]|nr:hypothetical protein [Nitrospirota bacterium]
MEINGNDYSRGFFIKKPRWDHPSGACVMKSLERLFFFVFIAETSLVGNNFPGIFFIDGGWNEGHHASPWAAVFNDPHQFAFFPFPVEFAIGKIPWSRIKNFTGRT